MAYVLGGEMNFRSLLNCNLFRSTTWHNCPKDHLTMSNIINSLGFVNYGFVVRLSAANYVCKI